MERLNKTCLCCGERYSYCPTCSRADALKETWHSEFCSSDCKDLWMSLTKYNMNMLSKSEVKDIIRNLNLKPINTYADCVKRDYDKIMVEEKKFKRGKRVEIKPIDEVVNVELVTLPTIEESHEVVVEKENE